MTQITTLRASPKTRLTKMSTASAPTEIAPRRFRGVASTSEVDRDRDRIISWDVSSLKKNPVLLLHHDQTRVIGKITSIEERGGELGVTFEILPEGLSADADFAYGALRHGALRSLSIGFRGRGEGNRYGGRDLHAEVYEVSLVAVPANPSALAARLGGKRGLNLTRAQLRAVIAAGMRDGFAACGHSPSRPVRSAPSRPVKRQPTVQELKRAVHEGMRRALNFHLGHLDDVALPPPSEAWRYR